MYSALDLLKACLSSIMTFFYSLCREKDLLRETKGWMGFEFLCDTIRVLSYTSSCDHRGGVLSCERRDTPHSLSSLKSLPFYLSTIIHAVLQATATRRDTASPKEACCAPGEAHMLLL